MDRAIKQRILGTLVLLAGSAALAPLVLDGSGTIVPHEVSIPPRPVVEPPPQMPATWSGSAPVVAPATMTQGTPPALTPSNAVVDKQGVNASEPAQVVPEDKPPVSQPVQEPVVHDKVDHKTVVVINRPIPPVEQHQEASMDSNHPAPALPGAWTVQVASLASADAARAFRSELLRRGYPVYQRQIGSAFKVFVGPELDKANAESLKEKLAKDGYSGWMQAYSVH